MWVALVRLIGGMLLTVAGSLAGRVLVALGIGFVTYKGVDVTTTFLSDQVKANINGLPVDVINFLAFCWIDKGIGMIFSTWTACIAVSGLASGLTKMRIKGS